MLKNNAAGPRVLLGVFFAVLLAVSGLASCGSGGGSTTVNTNPTVTLTVAATSVAYNATTTLNWLSDVSTECTLSGGEFGTGTTVKAIGSQSTNSLTTNTTYTVTCGSASQNVTITVASSAVSSVISGFTSAGGNVTITSANALTDGAAINISGTTSYNGTYTVANVTPTSFTIVASFVAGDTTGVWQVAGGMIAGCSTTGDTVAITLSTAPSRFNGVAPLAVFFDATGTTTTDPQIKPFHDLEYQWDFGDYIIDQKGIKVFNLSPPDVGTSTWNAGSRPGVSSRNTATGPVAAHVYETPGTYIVALSATDGTNSVSNSCAKIVVQDPDAVFAGANTTCIGATSLPIQGVGGCPADANTAKQSNFATAINTYALTGKRVLFKRGDTFTAATSAAITRTGPGIVGAFGAGVDPLVRSNALPNTYTSVLTLSNRSTPGIKDWRVMDMELDGSLVPDNGIQCTAPSAGGPATPVPPCTYLMGVGTDGGIDQITLLRLKIHDMHNGIQFSDSVLDYQNAHPPYGGHTMFDQVAIADLSVLHMIGGNGGVSVGVSAKRFSMLGTILDDSLWAEHNIRIFYMNKGVLSNNTLSRQAPTKGNVKLHGPTWCTQGSATDSNGRCVTKSTDYSLITMVAPYGLGGVDGGYSEQVVISDNKFASGNGATAPFVIGAENAQSDERVRSVIVERNWLIPGDVATAMLQISAVDVTARNNICIILNGACVMVSLRSIGSATISPEPPPDNVHVYNNTFYSASAGYFQGVNIFAPSKNTIVQNNLGSAQYSNPAPAFTAMVVDNGTGTIQGNNLLSSAIPSELFVNATPAIPAGFGLLPLPNPARDAGLATVPVFSDFFGTIRPQNGVIDIGAVEGP